MHRFSRKFEKVINSGNDVVVDDSNDIIYEKTFKSKFVIMREKSSDFYYRIVNSFGVRKGFFILLHKI